MNAEIIGIGSELLLGQIANTDAQFISQQLSYLGIDVYFHTVVGDNRKRILEALKQASERSDIIITTGGLGPTMDDLSKEVVAEYLGLELALHQPSLDKIEQYFKAMNRPMANNNEKQAMFPKEAEILPNDNGTAPGAVIEKDDKLYVILPGPPVELQPMFTNYAAPYLVKKSGSRIYSKVMRIYGIGESTVEEMVKDILINQSNPTIAPLASYGEVTLRITAKARSSEEAKDLMTPVENEIEARLGNAVYGYNDDSMEKVVVELLKDKRYTLAAAESCSGGHISDLLTNIPGVSEVLMESCVTYSNQAKVHRLGVKQETLDEFGAVSRQTAIEMAEGIRKSSGSDLGIAATGIAGPGGGSEEKPVGLVYIAIADKYGSEVKECRFNGSRTRIKHLTALRLLNWVRLKLLEIEEDNLIQ